MPRRLLKVVANKLSRTAAPLPPAHTFTVEDIVWAMGSFCALNRKPFDAELLIKQFPPPYSADSFIHAARALGFRIKRQECASNALANLNLPCMAVLHEAEVEPNTTELLVAEHIEQLPVTDSATTPSEPSVVVRKVHPAIIVQIDDKNVLLFEAGTNTPKPMNHAEFATRFTGTRLAQATEDTDF